MNSQRETYTDQTNLSAEELTRRANAWHKRKAAVKRHKQASEAASRESYLPHKVLSFFIPLAGLILCLVFISDANASEERRRAGWSCLFWASAPALILGALLYSVKLID